MVLLVKNFIQECYVTSLVTLTKRFWRENFLPSLSLSLSLSLLVVFNKLASSNVSFNKYYANAEDVLLFHIGPVDSCSTVWILIYLGSVGGWSTVWVSTCLGPVGGSSTVWVLIYLGPVGVWSTVWVPTYLGPVGSSSTVWVWLT